MPRTANTENTEQEQASAPEATLEKLAEDYAKTRVKKPGYAYRLVPNGNAGSKWVATKIERKA